MNDRYGKPIELDYIALRAAIARLKRIHAGVERSDMIYDIPDALANIHEACRKVKIKMLDDERLVISSMTAIDDARIIENLAQLVSRLSRLICAEYVEDSKQYEVGRKAKEYIRMNGLEGSILRTALQSGKQNEAN